MNHLIDCLDSIEDYRYFRNRKHNLVDILVIAISAMLCGFESFTDMELFGRAKQKFFESFLDLPNGIPSHDTFNRVFRILSFTAFEKAILSWLSPLSSAIEEKLIAIDGKTLRHSFDNAENTPALHLITAWLCEESLLLSQLAVDSKTNEIPVVQEMLKILSLKGSVVTLDAMHAQKKTTEIITQKGGDYIIALKANQGTLFDTTKECFDRALKGLEDSNEVFHHQTVGKGHGRIETRDIWTIPLGEHFKKYQPWSGLKTLVMVERKREFVPEINRKKRTNERRYYISSLSTTPQDHLQKIRNHWKIENSQHWILDVTFREDDCRVRKGNGIKNLAFLRRLSISLLKQTPPAISKKASIRARRKIAAINDEYLLEILCSLST